MDKYGVAEDEDLKKTASEDEVKKESCPDCGKKVEKHGSVSICPKHGTEPFEKKETEE